mmetsp:Transcript_817/g.1877  ORF Transcript_817/g.1877 Transcript_817/m.1877 type:complete len:533 (+) Transcript_817:1991-3589(+)
MQARKAGVLQPRLERPDAQARCKRHVHGQRLPCQRLLCQRLLCQPHGVVGRQVLRRGQTVQAVRQLHNYNASVRHGDKHRTQLLALVRGERAWGVARDLRHVRELGHTLHHPGDGGAGHGAQLRRGHGRGVQHVVQQPGGHHTGVHSELGQHHGGLHAVAQHWFGVEPTLAPVRGGGDTERAHHSGRAERRVTHLRLEQHRRLLRLERLERPRARQQPRGGHLSGQPKAGDGARAEVAHRRAPGAESQTPRPRGEGLAARRRARGRVKAATAVAHGENRECGFDAAWGKGGGVGYCLELVLERRETLGEPPAVGVSGRGVGDVCGCETKHGRRRNARCLDTATADVDLVVLRLRQRKVTLEDGGPLRGGGRRCVALEKRLHHARGGVASEAAGQPGPAVTIVVVAVTVPRRRRGRLVRDVEAGHCGRHLHGRRCLDIDGAPRAELAAAPAMVAAGAAQRVVAVTARPHPRPCGATAAVANHGVAVAILGWGGGEGVGVGGEPGTAVVIGAGGGGGAQSAGLGARNATGTREP